MDQEHMASVVVELIRLHAIATWLVALFDAVYLVTEPKNLRKKFWSVRNQDYTFIRTGYNLLISGVCIDH
jgi:hypothetical protein